MREDLKTALRSLRKSPTFTAVALVVLALGIGAGTAIFSVVDAVVLRGLPFDQHDRIVAVLEHDTTRPTTFGGGTTTTQMYLDWRRLQESFEQVAAVSNWTFRQEGEGGESSDVRAQRVTWEFFPTLRVAPLLGRAFAAEDEVEGRHRVVILSYGFWQRRFGGSPAVIGRTISFGTRGAEESWEIAGVMPRGFAYPVAAERPTEVYVPIYFQADDRTRGAGRNYNYTAIARLKKDVGIDQANDQMNRLMVALDQEHPKWSPGRRTRVITLHDHIVGRVRTWMLMLLGAVVLVLLIACANVANLMLARATVRSREIGIRAALGASRWRLVRGLLVEGVVLSLMGAAIGVLLAYAGVHILRAWLPAGLPRVAGIAIDLRVLGFSIGASVLTGVFFGIVPALQSSRPDLTAALKDSSRGSTAGAGSQLIRSMLVVAEVTLAVVLLVGAGLFTGSFIKLMRVDTGFDYHNVLTLNVGIPSRVAGTSPSAPTDERARRLRGAMQQVLDAVAGVPGVEMAGVVNGGLPLTGNWGRTSVELPGRGELKGDDDSIDLRTVSSDYLQVLRIPLRRGRYVTADDREGAPPVIVINETAARRYWPGLDAVGQRSTINSTERVVVGIVGDIRHLGPETPARQEAYIPMAQGRSVPSTLVARTTGDPVNLLPAVKAAISAVSRDIRTSGDIVTLDGYMDRLIAQRRFNMALLALFGLLGLVIAAAGIYGVMAYLVAQRTNEIGVRMALGATPRDVVSMVMKRAALLLAAGLAIGSAAAWSLSGLVGSFLFELQPDDVRIFIVALLALAASGLVASAVPARRAALVDPLIALRQE